jgi:hypothetical protein
MFKLSTRALGTLLFAGIIACAPLALMASLQSGSAPSTPAEPTPPKAASPSTNSTPAARNRARNMPARARNFYQTRWGVDSFTVKSVESGEMIRFSYRVLDPEKAKTLNDKHNEPALFDERAHVKLVVPTLEKVGQLRQSSTPDAGKVYWMVFSNKERYVKPGDRVSVVIGTFRVDGLPVD